MNEPFGITVTARAKLRHRSGWLAVALVAAVAFGQAALAGAAVSPQARSTATSVSSSSNPSNYGVTVTFTARVSPTDNGGTVTFTDGGVTLSGCSGRTLSGTGRATCTASGLAVGTHNIVATYTGDTNYTGSTSPTFVQTVRSLTTTTTLTTPNSSVAFGTTVNFTATVTPTDNGGSVAFTDGGTAISGCQTVSLTSDKAVCTTHGLSLGSNTIVAKYSGDTDYATSTSTTYTETVTIAPTTTALGSSVYPDLYGNPVTYTATVSPTDNGGTVSFTDDDSPVAGCQGVGLVSGMAQCTVALPTVGTHSIVATYSGDTDYATSTSSSFSELVTTSTTMTQLNSSAYPINYGTSVTYTATVSGGDGAGTVSFTDGGGDIDGCQDLSLTDNQATCEVDLSSVGTHAIVATYSGDTDYPGSTSSEFDEVVNPAPTSIFVVSSDNSVAYGTDVTYTATVSGSDDGGTVSFTDGGEPIDGCQDLTVSADQSACDAGEPSVGDHSIVATYSGDTDYAGSVSPTLDQTVSGSLPTSTSVLASAYPITYGESVTYTATVSGSDGGGTVTFTDGSDPIDGCQDLDLTSGQAACPVANSSVGSHMIVATYSGDEYYAGSVSSTFTETVYQTPTGTYVASSENPASYGDLVTYTATVVGGDGGGTVSFTDGADPIDGCQDVSLTDGQATCQVAADLGAHSIVATYSGDDDSAGSASVTFTENVHTVATSVNLTSSANPTTYGANVTYTATVSGSGGGGTVSFTSDDDPIDGCQNVALTDGQATCKVTVELGSFSLVATYSGDTDDAGSTSNTLDEIVNPSLTSVTLGSSANPSDSGVTVTFTATVIGSDGGGTVSFTDGSDPIDGCQSLPLTDGAAQCVVSTPAVGSHTVVATYSGDTDYAASTSNTLTQVVNKVATSVTLGTSASPVAYNVAVVYTATVTGSDGGGTVSFTDDAEPIDGCQSVALVDGEATCDVAVSSVGDHSIVATYSGDTDDAGSTSNTVIETVHQATTGVVVSSSAEPAKYGAPVTFTATVSGSNGGGTVTFTKNSVVVGTCQSVSLTAGRATCALHVAVGSYALVATYSGDENYQGSTSATFHEVVQKGTVPMIAKSTPKAAAFGHAVKLQGVDIPTSATGTVTFTFGKIKLCAARVTHGVATCFTSSKLARGNYLVTARYSGDANYVGVIKITRFTVS